MQSALSPGIALAHDLGPLCCLQLTGLAIAAEQVLWTQLAPVGTIKPASGPKREKKVCTGTTLAIPLFRPYSVLFRRIPSQTGHTIRMPFFRIFIFFDEVFNTARGTTYLMRDDGATVVNVRP